MTKVEVNTANEPAPGFSTRGLWWLPADPASKIGGELRFAAGEGGVATGPTPVGNRGSRARP